MTALTVRIQRAARELAGMNQKTLSEASGVPLPTIRAFESGQTQRMMAANERLIVEALEGAGVVFTPANGNGPGVAMRKDQADG
jgi:transcriptional regulator with XRE-family HTH domain